MAQMVECCCDTPFTCKSKMATNAAMPCPKSGIGWISCSGGDTVTNLVSIPWFSGVKNSNILTDYKIGQYPVKTWAHATLTVNSHYSHTVRSRDETPLSQQWAKTCEVTEDETQFPNSELILAHTYLTVNSTYDLSPFALTVSHCDSFILILNVRKFELAVSYFKRSNSWLGKPMEKFKIAVITSDICILVKILKYRYRMVIVMWI